ncbi:MAG: hypothetical protein ACI8Y4_002457 [Candidatus Poriferisodalaceae bacterium]|jgi:hypothetical protein
MSATSQVTPAIKQLNQGLTAALAVDFDHKDMTTGELVDDLEVLLPAGARMDALVARVTGAMDRSGAWAEAGNGSAVALLRSMAPNHHKSAAGRAVRNGERLRRTPLVASSFEAGRITSDHVRVFAELLPKRFEDRFPDFDEQLVEAAETLRFDEFCTLISRWKDAADGSEPDRRDKQDLEARELHLSWTFNQRCKLDGTLTPLARVTVGNELDRLTDIFFNQDWKEATERLGEGNVTKTDLARTPAQRRHDALVLMANRSAGAGKNPRLPIPRLYVHCTAAVFQFAFEADAGGDPEPVPFDQAMCELEDDTPISHKMLVRVAVQAEIRRVVIDPKSLKMKMGRSARMFNDNQRDAIAVRDRYCSCGCGLSARRCEADHIVEARDGGLTDVENGDPKCPPARRLKTNKRTENGPPSQQPAVQPRLILRE